VHVKDAIGLPVSIYIYIYIYKKKKKRIAFSCLIYKKKILGYDVLTKLPPATTTRFNLIGNTFVDRVLIKNKKAYGVKLDNGQEILANKRVILAAGAVFTPCVLIRSGVGPLDELKRLGVVQEPAEQVSNTINNVKKSKTKPSKPSKSTVSTSTNLKKQSATQEDRIPLSECVIHPSVGRRLYDRYNIRLRYFTDTITYSDQPNLIFSNLQVFNNNTQVSIEQPWYFLQFRSLYLYLISLLWAGQFYAIYKTIAWFFTAPPDPTTTSNPFSTSPPPKKTTTTLLQKLTPSLTLGISFERLPRLFMGCMVEFTTKIMIPVCGGKVTLLDRNPRSKPVIDFDYFQNRRDVEDITLGFDMVTHFASSMPFMANALPLFDPIKDRGDVERYKEICDTDWHYAGTCPMGEVVRESDFGVVGVEGLFVVDMSVAKRSSSLNTMATAFLVGKIAAERWFGKEKDGEGRVKVKRMQVGNGVSKKVVV
jgi:choline dehydrogenase-like flavoprotein